MLHSQTLSSDGLSQCAVSRGKMARLSWLPLLICLAQPWESGVVTRSGT